MVPAGLLVGCRLWLRGKRNSIMNANELSILSTPARRVILPLLAESGGLALHTFDDLTHSGVVHFSKGVDRLYCGCSRLLL